MLIFTSQICESVYFSKKHRFKRKCELFANSLSHYLKKYKPYTIITLIASQLSILRWNNKRRENETFLVIFLIIRRQKRKSFLLLYMQLCEEIQKLSLLYRSSTCLQWQVTSKKRKGEFTLKYCLTFFILEFCFQNGLSSWLEFLNSLHISFCFWNRTIKVIFSWTIYCKLLLE